MKQALIILALFFMYYHISGLSTTNILRLTKGCRTPVLSSKCVCDNCSNKIPPILQLPVISFVLCRGRCKFCGCKIPVSGLILEICILSGMFFITHLLGFAPKGVLFSFVFYEITRIFVVIRHGKRTDDFLKQYAIAVASMIPFFICTLFASLLYSVK